ncbi:hypothetical protein WJX77_003814 [Trebouxia sp. C0004]
MFTLTCSCEWHAAPPSVEADYGAEVRAVGDAVFEWSNEDMAAAMAKISELEAANAGLEASAKKKDATLGNISAMSLE